MKEFYVHCNISHSSNIITFGKQPPQHQITSTWLLSFLIRAFHKPLFSHWQKQSICASCEYGLLQKWKFSLTYGICDLKMYCFATRNLILGIEAVSFMVHLYSFDFSNTQVRTSFEAGSWKGTFKYCFRRWLKHWASLVLIDLWFRWRNYKCSMQHGRDDV